MSKPTPARFLLLFAASMLVAAAGILLFNTHGPMTSAKRQDKEWYVSRVLLSGRHLVPPDHLDECELRWSMAMQMSTRPDIAVMGSSHALLISRKNLPVPGLINFSISGACQAEHWVTTEILQKRTLAPRVMMIFVDPWLFDASTDWSLWQARAKELISFEARLCREEPQAVPVFSPRFLKKKDLPLRSAYSTDLLISYVNDLYVPVNLTIIPDPDKVPFTVMRSDGGTQINADRGRDSQPASRPLALRQLATNIDPHRYGSFDRIDENLWRLFTAWLRHCRAQGSEVWLLFPPYHPAIFPTIVAQPRNQLRKIETRMRQEAEALGVPCFGAYDPTALDFHDDCFADGDHLNEQGTQRLLAPVREAWNKKAEQR